MKGGQSTSKGKKQSRAWQEGLGLWGPDSPPGSQEQNQLGPEFRQNPEKNAESLIWDKCD